MWPGGDDAGGFGWFFIVGIPTAVMFCIVGVSAIILLVITSELKQSKGTYPIGEQENSGIKYVGEIKGDRCRICDRKITESEKAYVVDGELLCVECEGKLPESEGN
jgi:hypothetical protein